MQADESKVQALESIFGGQDITASVIRTVLSSKENKFDEAVDSLLNMTTGSSGSSATTSNEAKGEALDSKEREKIRTLENMFGNDLSNSVICTVLQSNRGELVDTVDTLLNMTSNEMNPQGTPRHAHTSSEAQRKAEQAKQQEELRNYDNFKRLQLALQEEEARAVKEQQNAIQEGLRKKAEAEEQKRRADELKNREMMEEQERLLRSYQTQKKTQQAGADDSARKALAQKQEEELRKAREMEERQEQLRREWEQKLKQLHSEEEKLRAEEAKRQALEEERCRQLAEKEAAILRMAAEQEANRARALAEEEERLKQVRLNLTAEAQRQQEELRKEAEKVKLQQAKMEELAKEKTRLKREAEERALKMKAEEEKRVQLRRLEEEKRAEEQRLAIEKERVALQNEKIALEKMRREQERVLLDQARDLQRKQELERQEREALESARRVAEQERLQKEEQEQRRVQQEREAEERRIKLAKEAEERRIALEREEEQRRIIMEKEEELRLQLEKEKEEEEAIKARILQMEREFEEKQKEEQRCIEEARVQEEERILEEQRQKMLDHQLVASTIFIPPKAETSVDTVVVTATATSSDSVTCTWEVPSSVAASTNWVGLYPVRALFNTKKYVQFMYTQGAESGQHVFNSVTPGHYEARFFTTKSYEHAARSAPLRVGPAVTLVSQLQGDHLLVHYALDPISLNPTRDWLGIYEQTQRRNKLYLSTAYGNADGQVMMKVPRAPGVYEVRLFAAGSVYNDQAKCEFVVEDNDCLDIDTSSVASGGSVTARWVVRTVDPSSGDWIGVYRADEANNNNYLSATYTQGTSVGVVSVPAPKDAGVYELRLFVRAKGKYTTFRVSPPLTVV